MPTKIEELPAPAALLPATWARPAPLLDYRHCEPPTPSITRAANARVRIPITMEQR